MSWKSILLGLLFALISYEVFSLVFNRFNIKNVIRQKKINSILFGIIILVACFFISVATTDILHNYAISVSNRYIFAGILSGLFTRLIEELFNKNS